MAGGVARGGMGGHAGDHFVALREDVQPRRNRQLADVKVGDEVVAERLRRRPGELSRTDRDAGVREHDPVDRVVVVGMGQDHVGDRVGARPRRAS